VRVRAVAVRDEVPRDGESVVLHDGQVLHLSVIATLLRSLASDWISLKDLTQAVELAVGPPSGGDAERLLTEQVGELERLGLLEVAP
jgi:hypothetical protein